MVQFKAFQRFKLIKTGTRQPSLLLHHGCGARGRSSLTPYVHPCTLDGMKLSISEARRRLPELVRHVSKDAGAKVEITVRDEVVAELRPALPEPEPGAAAKKLLAIMRKLPKRRGAKTRVSRRVKQYLYGSATTKR